jgi:hypothetical protein
MRGSPGVALVGLGEADLRTACGHSDFHEARHGGAVEGVNPAIGDCGDGRKARNRGLKAQARGLKDSHEGGVCEASPHITYQVSYPL